MKSKVFIAFLLTIIILLPVIASEESAEESEPVEETFTVYGKIYTKDGELANRTSIKVDSMRSSWSNDEEGSPDFGTYEFEGVTAGEHTIRAYFMNDGHTVSYRKIIVNSDLELNWTVGMNWVTAEFFNEVGDPIFDSSDEECELESCFTELLENDVKLAEGDWQNGRTEIGIYENDNYYSLLTSFGSDLRDGTCNEIHFKMEGGVPNDFDVYKGTQSKFGFITDPNGVPLADVVVSNGIENVITNSDGFYLLQNLTIGNNYELDFKQNGEELVEPINELILECDGWLNISSTMDINLPGNVTFESAIQTIPMGGFDVKWNGGGYTDYYTVYLNDEGVMKEEYKGASESYTFWAELAGTYEFTIEATNNNGTTKSNQPFLLIVLPEQSNQDLWSVGMSWSYHMTHTPEYQHNRTYTAIGSEIINDAFDNQRKTFLLRVYDDSYEEGEKSYRWVDSNNLLNIKTYWADTPSSSSYYQEGSLGWNFTDLNGSSADLLTSNGSLNMHFNRTNVIGVPGHPNGYTDTQNIVNIYENVMIETAAGNFSTTYYQIVDLKDDIISWELWYNDTVRNWVKIIDRLPGSHSDSVISELTAYNVPISPQFVTEGGNLSVKDYALEWGVFPGTEFYQLFENEMLIYQGENLSFEIKNKTDGEYTYLLMAFLNNNVIESSLLNLKIDYILPPPSNITTIPELNQGISVNILENEEIEISWDKIEEIKWYSVVTTDYFGDGVTIEIYNGTENKIVIDDLDVGQNRIQIKAALKNGKISEYSSSVFIIVEPATNSDSEEKLIPAPINILTSSLILIFVAIYKRK